MQYLDIEIDKLTNSLKNVRTGDVFQTDVILVNKEDVERFNEEEGWMFDWKSEFKSPDRDLYKLCIRSNFQVTQGLISLTEREDHVYVHLVESAPFNKGKNKVYLGVPGNLFAFACRLSFHRGFEGFVSFRSKTKLIEHYEDILGAQHIGNGLMIINSEYALKLIKKYFKEDS